MNATQRQRYPNRSESLKHMAMRCSRRAAVAGVLALAGLAQAGAQERPMLIEYLPEVEKSGDAVLGTTAHAVDEILGDSGVLALRIGHAAPESVIHARALSIVLPGSDESLTFDDLVVEALDSGYALYSRDRQSPTSTTLVVMGEDVMGTIHHDGAMYVVQPLDDGLTAVYLYDAAQLRKPPELKPDFVVPDADPDESDLPAQHAPSAAQDSRGRIDVLVVYSNSVRGGAGSVDTLIAQLVLRTNLAYRNSGITTSVRLVHSYETPYTPVAESGNDMEKDLERLRIRGDGYLDEMFAKRDQYGADVVILLTRNARAASNYCGGGLAYLRNPSNRNVAEWAFGVSATGNPACILYDATTFAHEIGHIQGAVHNPEQERLDGNDPNSIPYAYGHGFCNAARNWRTVMSYNTGKVCDDGIEHFSNPVVLYRGGTTGDHQLRNVARVINETAIHVANYRQSKTQQSDTRTLPFVPPASNITLQGFARIINNSDRDGVVRITAIDDRGQRRGPVTLSLDARAVAHFNSQDLENGNSLKGLSGGVGDGYGNWRLELATDLEIEHLAYLRTSDGFVTNMHEMAAETRDGSNRYHVPFFNPGKNRNQQSKLRLINPGSGAAGIEITGVDDKGRAPPGGALRLNLGAGMARMLTAYEIENGGSGLSGGLGAGSGKWRLSVSADRPIQVMSLLELPTGHLTNLSRGQDGVSVGTTPPPSNQPDLVVASLSAIPETPSPGQLVLLSAIVRNQGSARSAATQLRFYRSSDATITRTDTPLQSASIGVLSPSGATSPSISVQAPSAAGTYYYGACVDPVSGEANTGNNCSSAVRVTVSGTGGGSYVGAIAAGWQGQYCDDGFGWGYALNYTDRDAAISAAEAGCRNLQLNRCQWVVTFGQCGALAYGESSTGCGLYGGSGASESAAESSALSHCRSDAKSDCRIAVATSGSSASYCNAGAGAMQAADPRSDGQVTDSPHDPASSGSASRKTPIPWEQ